MQKLSIWISSLVIFLYFINSLYAQDGQYTPDWESLDTRPLPKWYDDAKFGIFIHWGVFSVPGFGSEWFWEEWKGANPSKSVVEFMQKNYPPGFTYADFAKEFTAEFFDPAHWADVFKASGARYVVLTSKHHEGYCLWPSANSWNWNSATVGPNRDLVGDLAQAIRNTTDIKFGLYHSLFEWFNPLYLNDKANGFKSQDFVFDKTLPELYDIVKRYKPDVIWSDGEWEATDKYWNSTEFIAWLYNESPVKDTIVVNDRWGAGDLCHHGDFYTCTDNYNPGVLMQHKWENCMTIDRHSWGYRRNMNLGDVKPIEELLGSMVETISCGGNILINIGPTKEGTIVPIFEERLRQIGQWLSVNGEAVYESRAWKYQNDTINSNIWYTSKHSDVYAFLLKQNVPKIVLGAPQVSAATRVSLLGYSNDIQWVPSSQGLIIDATQINKQVLNTKWVWVFKLENVS